MYAEFFDSYLPTHKRVGNSKLIGKCDNCELEVTLETSDGTFKFVDTFTESDLCFKRDAFRDLADGARKWKSIVSKFDSGATRIALNDLSSPEKVEHLEKRAKQVAELNLDILYAYIDLYSQTPKFDVDVVEKILSPISLI